jgi:hypothetical protein
MWHVGRTFLLLSSWQRHPQQRTHFLTCQFVHGWGQIIPDGPIPPEQTNGTAFDVELVPIGHSNAMRITVLPVLA